MGVTVPRLVLTMRNVYPDTGVGVGIDVAAIVVVVIVNVASK